MDKSKWEYKKLGEVAKFINGDRGVNYPSQSDFVEFGVPFVNAGHLKNNAIDFSSMNYIAREKFDKLGSGKIQKGDLLFCLRGSLGKKAIVDNIEEGAIASSLVILRPSAINTRFLSYYLESPLINDEIEKSNNGSSQPNLSAKSVSQFLIPIPQDEDQQRIVAELDCLNEMIALKQEQLKEFDKLAQSIFYDMFGGDTYSKLELASLYEFIDYRGKTPNKIKAGIPLITARNIRFGYLDYSVQEYISEDEFETRQSRGIAKKGDLLFTTEAPMGFAAIADLDVFSTGQRVITFQLKNGVHINNLYMLYYLMSEEFQQILLNNATGVTVKGIKAAKLKRIKVSIPPLALQQQFAEKIQAIEAQKELVKQSIAETQQLFDSRMDYYFN